MHDLIATLFVNHVQMDGVRVDQKSYDDHVYSLAIVPDYCSTLYSVQLYIHYSAAISSHRLLPCPIARRDST